jgi:hypothetical protein
MPERNFSALAEKVIELGLFDEQREEPLGHLTGADNRLADAVKDLHRHIVYCPRHDIIGGADAERERTGEDGSRFDSRPLLWDFLVKEPHAPRIGDGSRQVGGQIEGNGKVGVMGETQLNVEERAVGNRHACGHFMSTARGTEKCADIFVLDAYLDSISTPKYFQPEAGTPATQAIFRIH